MKRYNLTWWQRAGLPLLYIHWFLYDKEKRKPWHLVLKGMEPHKHNFVRPIYSGGFLFMGCDHEGCTEVTEPEEVTK